MVVIVIPQIARCTGATLCESRVPPAKLTARRVAAQGAIQSTWQSGEDAYLVQRRNEIQYIPGRQPGSNVTREKENDLWSVAPLLPLHDVRRFLPCPCVSCRAEQHKLSGRVPLCSAAWLCFLSSMAGDSFFSALSPHISGHSPCAVFCARRPPSALWVARLPFGLPDW